MRDDLISRQAAIDAVCKVSCESGYCGIPCDDVKAIEQLPSAQPERKTGEWKHLKGDEWLCSNCGYVVWTEGSWEHPLERGKDYCEHCGADMRGETNEPEGI